MPALALAHPHLPGWLQQSQVWTFTTRSLISFHHLFNRRGLRQGTPLELFFEWLVIPPELARATATTVGAELTDHVSTIAHILPSEWEGVIAEDNLIGQPISLVMRGRLRQVLISARAVIGIGRVNPPPTTTAGTRTRTGTRTSTSTSTSTKARDGTGTRTRTRTRTGTSTSASPQARKQDTSPRLWAGQLRVFLSEGCSLTSASI